MRFICAECGAAFTNRDEWTSHVDLQHQSINLCAAEVPEDEVDQAATANTTPRDHHPILSTIRAPLVASGFPPGQRRKRNLKHQSHHDGEGSHDAAGSTNITTTTTDNNNNTMEHTTMDGHHAKLNGHSNHAPPPSGPSVSKSRHQRVQASQKSRSNGSSPPWQETTSSSLHGSQSIRLLVRPDHVIAMSNQELPGPTVGASSAQQHQILQDSRQEHPRLPIHQLQPRYEGTSSSSSFSSDSIRAGGAGTSSASSNSSFDLGAAAIVPLDVLLHGRGRLSQLGSQPQELPTPPQQSSASHRNAAHGHQGTAPEPLAGAVASTSKVGSGTGSSVDGFATITVVTAAPSTCHGSCEESDSSSQAEAGGPKPFDCYEAVARALRGPGSSQQVLQGTDQGQQEGRRRKARRSARRGKGSKQLQTSRRGEGVHVTGAPQPARGAASQAEATLPEDTSAAAAAAAIAALHRTTGRSSNIGAVPATATSSEARAPCSAAAGTGHTSTLPAAAAGGGGLQGEPGQGSEASCKQSEAAAAPSAPGQNRRSGRGRERKAHPAAVDPQVETMPVVKGREVIKPGTQPATDTRQAAAAQAARAHRAVLAAVNRRVEGAPASDGGTSVVAAAVAAAAAAAAARAASSAAASTTPDLVRTASGAFQHHNKAQPNGAPAVDTACAAATAAAVVALTSRPTAPLVSR